MTYYELEQKVINDKNELAKIFQERLDWLVQTERYELACNYRDSIKYMTTDDEDWKKQYMDELTKKYMPEDMMDCKLNPTPEKIKAIKKKYLHLEDFSNNTNSTF